MKTNANKRIVIFDTTLRDGEQSPGFHMKPAEKLLVARKLARLGVNVIEAGFPVSSPLDFQAVRTIAQTVGRGAGAPAICGLARCAEKDIDACWEAVRPARKPRIHLFIATSDIHMKYKLKMTRAEVLARIKNAVRRAASYTTNIQLSAEDATRTDPRFLAEVIRAGINAGATTINIPDTVGFTTPLEYAALIRDMRARVPELKRVNISVHCQNDLGLATANSLSAVQAGAQQVECTINGIGERAGNCALEEVVMALHTRRNVYHASTTIRTSEIYSASQLVTGIVHVGVQPNKAIVGENAFAHASGVHQDGMIKNRRTYEIMNPADIGAPPSKLILTARSGRRALIARLENMSVRIKPDQFDDVYARFKRVADRKRIVGDQDLRNIVMRGRKKRER